EIFGPVLPIVTYRTPGEALQYVRSRPQPLAFYAFGNGRETRDALAGTTSGGASVNNVLHHLANPELPFGGVGPSGLGNYHGRAGFRTFSHERSVLRQSGNPMSRWLAPPYAGRMNRLVSRLARFLEGAGPPEAVLRTSTVTVRRPVAIRGEARPLVAGGAVDARQRARIQSDLTALAAGDRSVYPAVFAALWPLLRRFSERSLGNPDLAQD